MSARPQPFELWQKANGDRDEYLRLMREHGHIIPASEGGVRPYEPAPVVELDKEQQ